MSSSFSPLRAAIVSFHESTSNRTKGTVAVAAFALIGSAYIMASHAATSVVSGEPESGILASSAVQITDSTASGGQAVRFPAGATPPPTTPPPPATGSETPVGVTGSFSRIFTDEFNGTSVDSSKWATNWFGGTNMNGYTKLASNISFSGGSVLLQDGSDKSGSILTSNPNNGGGINGGFEMGINTYAEARIYFPGPNGTTLYNWPAWWTNPQTWPNGGEVDIFEVLGGTATSNYHSSSGANNSGTIAGSWANAYHTYAVWRKSGKNEIYWDGKLIRSYTTNDGGANEYLILTNGDGSPSATGPASAVKVDYVRVWRAN